LILAKIPRAALFILLGEAFRLAVMEFIVREGVVVSGQTRRPAAADGSGDD